MSSDRPKLKLDEQSFETLLAAAYTVQEHHAKQKRTADSQGTCAQCGGTLDPEHQFCGHCGVRRDELRPGERLQRNWASLWTMSQKQGGVPNFTSTKFESAVASDDPATPTLDSEIDTSQPLWADETSLSENEEIQAEENHPDLRSLLLPSQLDSDAEAEITEESEETSKWNLRLILRFHRGDLYLAVAILIAVVVLGWVIFGAPLTRGVAKGPQLTVGQRTLVKLGIADAPDRPVVYHGNPSARVWADPHTALYYCDGDDQFGNTRGGHYSTQKEAQMDRFSPAARTPCR